MPEKEKQQKSKFSKQENFAGSHEIPGHMDPDGSMHYNAEYFRYKFDVVFDDDNGTITAENKDREEIEFLNIREFLRSDEVSQETRTDVWNRLREVRDSAKEDTCPIVIKGMLQEMIEGDEALKEKVESVLGCDIESMEKIDKETIESLDKVVGLSAKIQKEFENILNRPYKVKRFHKQFDGLVDFTKEIKEGFQNQLVKGNIEAAQRIENEYGKGIDFTDEVRFAFKESVRQDKLYYPATIKHEYREKLGIDFTDDIKEIEHLVKGEVKRLSLLADEYSHYDESSKLINHWRKVVDFESTLDDIGYSLLELGRFDKFFRSKKLGDLDVTPEKEEEYLDAFFGQGTVMVKDRDALADNFEQFNIPKNKHLKYLRRILDFRGTVHAIVNWEKFSISKQEVNKLIKGIGDEGKTELIASNLHKFKLLNKEISEKLREEGFLEDIIKNQSSFKELDKITQNDTDIYNLLYEPIQSMSKDINDKKLSSSELSNIRAKRKIKEKVVESRTEFKSYIQKLLDESKKETLNLKDKFDVLELVKEQELNNSKAGEGEHLILNTKAYSDLLLLLIEKDKTFQEFGLVNYLNDLQNTFPKNTIKHIQEIYKTYYDLLNSEFFQDNNKIIVSIIGNIIDSNKKDTGSYIFDVLEYIKKDNEIISNPVKKERLVKYIHNMEVFSLSLFEIYLKLDESELDSFFENIGPLKRELQFYSLEQLKGNRKHTFSKDEETNNTILNELLLEVSPPSGSHVSKKETVLRHYRQHASLDFDKKMKKDIFNSEIHPEWFDEDGIYLETRDVVAKSNYKIEDSEVINSKSNEYNTSINNINIDFTDVDKYIKDFFDRLKNNNKSQIDKNEIMSYLEENLKKLYLEYLQINNEDFILNVGEEDQELYNSINRKQNLLYGDMMKEFTYFVYKHITGKETTESGALLDLLNQTIIDNYKVVKIEKVDYLEGHEMKVKNIMQNTLLNQLSDCICNNKEFKIEGYFQKLYQSEGSDYDYKNILESIIKDDKFIRRLRSDIKKQVGQKWEEKESEFINITIPRYISDLSSELNSQNISSIISQNINIKPIKEIKKEQEEYKKSKNKNSKDISKKDLGNMFKDLFRDEVLSLEDAKKGFKKTIGDIVEVRFRHERNSNTIIGGANSEICIWEDSYINLIGQSDTGFIPMNIDQIDEGYTHFRIDNNQGDGCIYIVVSINPKESATTNYGTDVFIDNVVNLIKKGYSTKDKIRIVASTLSGTGSNNNAIIQAHNANKNKITLESPVNMGDEGYPATACVVLYEQVGDEKEMKKNIIEIEQKMEEVITNKTLLSFLSRDKLNIKTLKYLENNEVFKDSVSSYLAENIKLLEDKCSESVLKDEITNVLKYCVNTKSIPYPIGITNEKGEQLKFSNYEGEYSQTMTQMS